MPSWTSGAILPGLSAMHVSHGSQRGAFPARRSVAPADTRASRWRDASRGWLVATCLLTLTTACLPTDPPAIEPPPAVRFAEDVQPILAQRCFSCHGGDAGSRQANLRLDTSD